MNIDLVRPEKTSTPVGGGRADKILLVLNEFRYGVKGERGLRDSLGRFKENTSLSSSLF